MVREWESIGWPTHVVSFSVGYGFGIVGVGYGFEIESDRYGRAGPRVEGNRFGYWRNDADTRH